MSPGPFERRSLTRSRNVLRLEAYEAASPASLFGGCFWSHTIRVIDISLMILIAINSSAYTTTTQPVSSERILCRQPPPIKIPKSTSSVQFTALDAASAYDSCAHPPLDL